MWIHLTWIIGVLHNISMGGGNDKENQLKNVDGWIMVITKPKGPRNISWGREINDVWWKGGFYIILMYKWEG